MSYQHFNHYHLPRLQEMGRVYWCHGFSEFGLMLASIFVPIFLLKNGYSFQEVLFYLLAQNLLAAILQIPAGKLFQYISPHHLMALGGIFQIIFFGFLATLDGFHWPLLLIALIWAIDRVIYWPAFHYVFSLARAHKGSGRQIAGINSLVIFGAAAAPAVGGIIATVFGINYTYFAAISIMLISIIPMLRPNQGPSTVKFNLAKTKLREIKGDLAANLCNGSILITELAIWPILIFTLISSYAGIGLLSSVIAITSIALTLFVGRNQEKTGEKHYIKNGMLAYSLTSIGRSIVQNSLQVFGLNLLAGVGRSLYTTPFMSRYYHNSDGEHRLNYIISMETAFSLGNAIFLAILITLSVFLSMQAVLTIGLASIALTSFGIRLIR